MSDNRRTAQHIRWLLPALLLTMSGAAWAIEGAPAETGSTEKKPDDYVVVVGDRRDPFSFTKALPEAPRQDNTLHNGDEDPREIKMDQAAIQAKKTKALEFYSKAETALMSMNATESLAQCDEGLNVFKDVKMNFYKELQDVRDQLLRLRKAADRIHQRQDAERDFNSMSLRLTGVVAREKNSQAIVNNQVVTKGSVVPTTQEGVEVVVADILPQQVVFIYRGYKMTLTMSEK